MKDTLPYFLGAVDESHFRLIGELDELLKRLRLLEAQELKQIQGIDISRSRVNRILVEGKRVGLVRQDYQAVDDSVFDYLVGVAATPLDAPDILPDFGETIERLRGEQTTLQTRLIELNQEVRAAQAFLHDQTDFSREVTEQRARLKSIELFKADSSSAHHCPLCESSLQTPTPKVEQMEGSLRKISAQLEGVYRDSPHIQKHIHEIEEKIVDTTESLRNVQTELGRSVVENEAARARQDQLVLRGRFLGRLSEFLESVAPERNDTAISDQIKDVKLLVASIRSRINSDDTESKMETILSLISDKMTEYSELLDLEHSGSSLRLDLKKLTVVANTVDGPIPLNRMGSGENWVGYHVLSHLALHWWLRKKRRPVPAFLIFDQPTQAYYPPDRTEGGLDQIDKDDDRAAVQALFYLMKVACEEIDPDFQLIVLDHAHLKDEWFETSIVEEWRGKTALVPYDWPDR